MPAAALPLAHVGSGVSQMEMSNGSSTLSPVAVSHVACAQRPVCCQHGAMAKLQSAMTRWTLSVSRIVANDHQSTSQSSPDLLSLNPHTSVQSAEC